MTMSHKFLGGVENSKENIVTSQDLEVGTHVSKETNISLIGQM